MAEAILNIVAASICIGLLVWNLIATRKLAIEAAKAQVGLDLIEPLAEKARLYDEMQEQLAKIGTLVDARKAAAKAGRERIEAEGYALEWETNQAPEAGRETR